MITVKCKNPSQMMFKNFTDVAISLVYRKTNGQEVSCFFYYVTHVTQHFTFNLTTDIFKRLQKSYSDLFIQICRDDIETAYSLKHGRSFAE